MIRRMIAEVTRTERFDSRTASGRGMLYGIFPECSIQLERYPFTIESPPNNSCTRWGCLRASTMQRSPLRISGVQIRYAERFPLRLGTHVFELVC